MNTFISDSRFLDTFKLGTLSKVHWYATFILDDWSRFNVLSESDDKATPYEESSIKIRLTDIDIPTKVASTYKISFVSTDIERYKGQSADNIGTFTFLDNSLSEYTEAFRNKLGLPQTDLYDFSKVLPHLRKNKVHLKITYNDEDFFHNGIDHKILQHSIIFEDIIIIGVDDFKFSYKNADYRGSKVSFVFKRHYGGLDKNRGKK